MEEIDIENRGNRGNPDRKKSWKEYIRKSNSGSRRVYRKRKKMRNSQLRNRRKEDIRKEDMRNENNNDSFSYKNIEKMKDMAYDEIKHKNLKEIQARRSGRYCLKCGDMFCSHRAKESAYLIFHSWKQKDGDFAYLYKDIILLLTKIVYQTQLDFIKQLASIRGFPTPSLYSEVYLNFIYYK